MNSFLDALQLIRDDPEKFLRELKEQIEPPVSREPVSSTIFAWLKQSIKQHAASGEGGAFLEVLLRHIQLT
jgi:hypothetical protein